MINFLEDKVSNFITLFSLFLHKELSYFLYLYILFCLYIRIKTYLYVNSIFLYLHINSISTSLYFEKKKIWIKIRIRIIYIYKYKQSFKSKMKKMECRLNWQLVNSSLDKSIYYRDSKWVDRLPTFPLWIRKLFSD